MVRIVRIGYSGGIEGSTAIGGEIEGIGKVMQAETYCRGRAQRDGCVAFEKSRGRTGWMTWPDGRSLAMELT